jgi:DNA-binding IclR family transcriptional regulator
MRIPLLIGSTGTCVLASWPRAEHESDLCAHPLPHFTKRSIIDPQQFLARVDEVARTGISIEREEFLDGVNAVATPLYGMGAC